MNCVPLGIEVVVNAACPFVSVTGPPIGVPGFPEVVDAPNCTVPVGVVPPDFEAATAAVSVTLAPVAMDAFDVVTLVVEAGAFTVTVTCCVVAA